MNKLIIPIFLLISINSYSQVTNYNLPPKTFYNRVNITLKDYKKIECKKVNLKLDSIAFTNLTTKNYEIIPLSNVDYLRVQEGTQVLKWSGLGALFLGLSAILSATEYPDSQMSGGKIVGFTLSGAVIGGLIGSAIPRWKTYYINNK